MLLQPRESKFELPPPGMHESYCVDFVYLGERGYQGREPYKQCYFTFILPTTRTLPDGKVVNHTHREYFPAYMGPNDRLRKFIEKWRGASLEQSIQRNNGWDPESAVGKPCMLYITHVPKRNKPEEMKAEADAMPPQDGFSFQCPAFERERDKPSDPGAGSSGGDSSFNYGANVDQSATNYRQGDPSFMDPSQDTPLVNEPVTTTSEPTTTTTGPIGEDEVW